MLHPPLTYLGDAFQYRTADGKFNNILVPHLGQGGAPYAKTVTSKTHLLRAQPDPGDIFDRLMAREPGSRPSESGMQPSFTISFARMMQTRISPTTRLTLISRLSTVTPRRCNAKSATVIQTWLAETRNLCRRQTAAIATRSVHHAGNVQSLPQLRSNTASPHQ